MFMYGEGWKVGNGFGTKAVLYFWQYIVVLDWKSDLV
jgi:hypothetical protein